MSLAFGLAVAAIASVTGHVSGGDFYINRHDWHDSHNDDMLHVTGHTESHLKSFIESEGLHLRLFLMLSMMPLKRWMATENI